MRPVSRRLCVRSKARGPLCAFPRRDSFRPALCRSSSVIRAFSRRATRGVPRHRHKTRRRESLRMAWHRARAIAARVRSEVGLSSDRRAAGRCARSQTALAPAARQSLALLPRPRRRRRGRVLSRAATERSSVQRKRSPRAFLRFRRACCSGSRDRGASARARNRTIVFANPAASTPRFRWHARR